MAMLKHHSLVKACFEQGKRNLSLFCLIYIPVLVLLSLVSWVAIITNIPLSTFTRDTTAVAGVSPLTGMVSNLGILIWCSAATTCFSVAYVLRKQVGRCRIASFFFFSGVITTILLLDDLFLFHETVIPDLLHIRQEAVYSLYIVIIVIYLVRYRGSILSTDFLLLFLAFFLFGASILIDLSPWSEIYIVEDGSKLLGIVTWAAYLMRSGFQIFGSHVSPGGWSL